MVGQTLTISDQFCGLLQRWPTMQHFWRGVMVFHQNIIHPGLSTAFTHSPTSTKITQWCFDSCNRGNIVFLCILTPASVDTWKEWTVAATPGARHIKQWSSGLLLTGPWVKFPYVMCGQAELPLRLNIIITNLTIKVVHLLQLQTGDLRA